MKRLLTLSLFCLIGLLSACGGGSANPPAVAPPSTTATVTCSLPLQYANGGTSGVAILPQARSVDRHLVACNISQVQSATLTVCIDHPNRSELAGQLLLSGTVLAPFQLADGVLRGNSCLSNSSTSTALLEFTVNNPDTRGLNPASGPWNLAITDTVQNNQNGYFVAWALEIKGLP